ncbi:MAG: DNA polymerase III subunit delta [Candidatus Omnitrophica bacterium]|nr:DNA polymerase III subunit delta [Candidatus Omnitrophota bacterium]
MAENFLIIGDDSFIRRKEADKLKEKFSVNPDSSGFDISSHDAADFGNFMDSVQTLPFLSKKRIVILNDAEKLSEKEMESVLAYLKAPVETTVLVISAAPEIAKIKTYKEVIGAVKLIEARRPDAATMKKWIKNFFARENIAIRDEVVDLIFELKGSDSMAVKNELDKLAAGVSEGEIKLSDVEEMVGRSTRDDVFKIVDAVDNKDAARAFRVLRDLTEGKKQHVEIIGYLGWYVKTLQNLKYMMNEGYDMQGIASEIGYSPAYVRRLSGQAKKYSAQKINRWIKLVFETDRDIKTGRREGNMALDMLISSLLL